MNFNEYQEEATKTANYPVISINGKERLSDVLTEYIYPTIGLCGEAGEVAEKVKKIIRDGNGYYSPKDVSEIKKELGDVLWYVSEIAKVFKIKLEDIANANIDKLKSRKERGKIHGSGDNR